MQSLKNSKNGSSEVPQKRPWKVSELESQVSQLQEELKKVKDQLASCGASQKQLTDNLRHKITENLFLVEELECQLSEFEKSESQALELLTDTQVKLKMAKTVEENLRAGGVKAVESYKSMALELEKLRLELIETKAGAADFRLDAIEAERQTMLYVCSVIELQENICGLEADLRKQKVEMGAELEKAKSEIDELTAKIVAYEKTKPEFVSELERAKAKIEELTTEIRASNETNNENKVQLKRLEKENKELKAEMESEKARAMYAVGYLIDEAEEVNQKADSMAKQLEAVQGKNAEMETELRKLKVQSDQWSKDAEFVMI